MKNDNPLNLTTEQHNILRDIDPEILASNMVSMLSTTYRTAFRRESLMEFTIMLTDLVRYAKTGKGALEASDLLVDVGRWVDPFGIVVDGPDRTSNDPIAVVLIAAWRRFETDSSKPLPDEDN